jgi:hypothetical protein
MHDRLHVNSLKVYDNGAFIRYGHFVGHGSLSKVYDVSGVTSTTVFGILVNNVQSNFHFV